MPNLRSERFADETLVLSRILLVALFLISGWGKLTDYTGTVGYMAQTGVPVPALAAVAAIMIEVVVSIAILVGFWTRPLAALMAVYTLATALIGHHYWTVPEAEHSASMINFYKNVSIVGGFLLLYVTGAGRHSIDARMGKA